MLRCVVNLKTEMNYEEQGVHGGQTKEGLGFAESRKAKGGLTPKGMAHPAIKILDLLPAVSCVVNSRFPF